MTTRQNAWFGYQQPANTNASNTLADAESRRDDAWFGAPAPKSTAKYSQLSAADRACVDWTLSRLDGIAYAHRRRAGAAFCQRGDSQIEPWKLEAITLEALRATYPDVKHPNDLSDVARKRLQSIIDAAIEKELAASA